MLKILRKKYARYREMLFDEVPFDARPLFAGSKDLGETHSILQTWAASQEDPIRSLVLAFLDDPTDEEADRIIKLLPYNHEQRARRKRKRSSLVQVILKAIKSAPRDKTDLYASGREFLVNSKRPEAAVRQALRTLQRRGLIEERSGFFYPV